MRLPVFVFVLVTVLSVQANRTPEKGNRTPVQGDRTPSVQTKHASSKQTNGTPSLHESRTTSVQANRVSVSVQESRTPPVQESRTPPVQEKRTPPVQESRTPPIQESRTPPVQESRTPPVQKSWTPPIQESRPPPVQESRTTSEQESRTPPVQESRTTVGLHKHRTASVKQSRTSPVQGNRTHAGQAKSVHSTRTPFKQISQTGADECTFKTSRGLVDLTPLVSQNGTARFTAQGTQYEYLWNPCLAFSAEQACQDAAICQRVYSTNFFVLLARQGGLIQDKEGQLMLSYTGTDPTDLMTRQTYITLICDSTIDGDFKFEYENPIREYHFTLRSKYACEKHSPLTGLLTTPTSPPGPGPAPSPSPPQYSLFVVIVLLACILLSLCILNCMVCLGLLTRSRKRENKQVRGHMNQAYEGKLPLP